MRSTETLRSLVVIALVIGAFGVTASSLFAEAPLQRRHIEPVGDLYTQIVEVEAHGVRTLYVSGQVGRGETLEEQSIAAYANLAARLDKVGASVDDIVKLVTYVVDWTAEKADPAFAGFYRIYEGRAAGVPAHTLVGVDALYSPHALIEVEAIAVVETSDDE